MRFYLHDGAYHELPPGAMLPDGAVEVDRLPEVGEDWDHQAGRFCKDHGLCADMNMPAGAVERAHALKHAEAAMILSGFHLTHGILAEEARVTGEDLTDLAARVFGKTETFRAAEIERRRIKTGN